MDLLHSMECNSDRLDNKKILRLVKTKILLFHTVATEISLTALLILRLRWNYDRSHQENQSRLKEVSARYQKIEEVKVEASG